MNEKLLNARLGKLISIQTTPAPKTEKSKPELRMKSPFSLKSIFRFKWFNEFENLLDDFDYPTGF